MNPATAWNFAAGPARLPDAVLERARERLVVRGADGASALERPFTGDAFRATLHSARERLAQLLELPAGYRILFLAALLLTTFSFVHPIDESNPFLFVVRTPSHPPTNLSLHARLLRAGQQRFALAV
ncbi:MAG TPA: hypothetical protein PLT98_12305, partial [Thauera aminoaromatica]|nr:hypothetical protein [Thauera aminoaromatica]